MIWGVNTIIFGNTPTYRVTIPLIIMEVEENYPIVEETIVL